MVSGRAVALSSRSPWLGRIGLVGFFCPVVRVLREKTPEGGSLFYPEDVGSVPVRASLGLALGLLGLAVSVFRRVCFLFWVWAFEFITLGRLWVLYLVANRDLYFSGTVQGLWFSGSFVRSDGGVR